MASQATSTSFSLDLVTDRSALRDRRLLLHLSVFFVAFFVIFLRRPDAILNAQFYAEDGKYWFAEAYNLGWRFFDFLLLAVLVLDGPLGILLIPIAAILRWIRKERRFNLALIALIPPAVLQLIIMATSTSRRSAPNGATLKLFTSIVGGQ